MIFEPWMKTFYHEHGYLVVKQVLTTEDMAAVSTRTDEIVKNSGRDFLTDKGKDRLS